MDRTVAPSNPFSANSSPAASSRRVFVSSRTIMRASGQTLVSNLRFNRLYVGSSGPSRALVGQEPGSLSVVDFEQGGEPWERCVRMVAHHLLRAADRHGVRRLSVCSRA